MRFYTASLEKFKIQCDSVVFVFKPREFTFVNDHLAAFVAETVKYRGVFSVPDDCQEDDDIFRKKKRRALLDYLGIWLRERIINFLAYQDELRKKGATIVEDPRLVRALKWQSELRQVLGAEAPIEEELSFLETKRTENTQSVEEVKPVEPSFAEVAVEKKGRRKSLEAQA